MTSGTSRRFSFSDCCAWTGVVSSHSSLQMLCRTFHKYVAFYHRGHLDGLEEWISWRTPVYTNGMPSGVVGWLRWRKLIRTLAVSGSKSNLCLQVRFKT